MFSVYTKVATLVNIIIQWDIYISSTVVEEVRYCYYMK